MAFDGAHTLAEAVDRTNEYRFAVLCGTVFAGILCYIRPSFLPPARLRIFLSRMGNSLRIVSILALSHRPTLHLPWV
jgi:hypothetical protein